MYSFDYTSEKRFQIQYEQLFNQSRSKKIIEKLEKQKIVSQYVRTRQLNPNLGGFIKTLNFQVYKEMYQGFYWFCFSVQALWRKCVTCSLKTLDSTIFIVLIRRDAVKSGRCHYHKYALVNPKAFEIVFGQTHALDYQRLVLVLRGFNN